MAVRDWETLTEKTRGRHGVPPSNATCSAGSSPGVTNPPDRGYSRSGAAGAASYPLTCLSFPNRLRLLIAISCQALIPFPVPSWETGLRAWFQAAEQGPPGPSAHLAAPFVGLRAPGRGCGDPQGALPQGP